MPVCILGMHRSGTSMVTHLLHTCGLYLGDPSDLLPPSDENPLGYWENRLFVHFNDELLAALDGSWDSPPVLLPDWPEDPRLKALQHRAQGLVTAFRGNEPWGWKDPRNTLTLAFWRRLFGDDLRVIVCMRSPIEAAQSISRRQVAGAPVPRALELWQIYHETLLQFLPDNALFTHYDSYFYDASAELQRILDFAQLTPSAEQFDAALDLIRAPVRREMTAPVLNNRQLPPAVQQHYTAFESYCGPVYARLMVDDAQRADTLSRNLLTLYDDWQAQKRRAESLEADLHLADAQQKAVLAELASQHEAALSTLREQRTAEAEAAHSAALSEVLLRYEEEVETLRAKLVAEAEVARLQALDEAAVHHAQELETLRSQLVESVDAARDAALAEAVAEHKQALNALYAQLTQEAELAQLRAAEALAAQHTTELAALRTQLTEQAQVAQQAAIAELSARHAAELRSLAQQRSAEMEAQRQRYEADLHAAEQTRRAELANLSLRYDAALEQMRRAAAAERAALEAERESALRALRAEFEQMLHDTQHTHEEEMRRLQERHDAECRFLELSAAREREQLERTALAEIEQLNAELASLRETMADSQGITQARAQEITALEERLRAEMAAADARTEQAHAEALRWEREVFAMRGTRGWQMLEGWWRFKARRLPEGSRRLYAYYLLRSSFGFLSREGLGGFLSQLGRWLRGERRYTRTAVLPAPPPALASVAEHPVLRVLFVHSGDPALGNSRRYRAENLAEQLRLRGAEASLMQDIDCEARLHEALSYDVIVLQRVIQLPPMRALLDAAHAQGRRIVFDLDDFIFDPAIVDQIDAVRQMNESQRSAYLRGVLLYRETLEAADVFTGTTHALVAGAQRLGKNGFVLRNGLNSEQLALADHALDLRRQRASQPIVRIGYLAGTRTHRADFAVCVPALVRLMQDYPQVRLVLRGEIDIPAELELYRPRIELVPSVPWREMLIACAELDINLAPLEPDSLFTEAKSALKYFETALLEIPTVASPTEDFAVSIRHGENGFLASTESDWYNALEALVKDENLRLRLGQAARQDALRTRTPQAQADTTLATYQAIRAGQAPRLTINWLMVRPDPGSGGARMVIRMADELQRLGHQVRIYIHDDGVFATASDAERFLRTHFLDTRAEIMLGAQQVESCNALIATFWLTANLVAEQISQARAGFYFVQDYEPFFYELANDARGVELASATYNLGLRHITIGPWLAHHLRSLNSETWAEFFAFPIDHGIYYAPPERSSLPQVRVLFLARTRMPRRRLPLGLEALRIFHARHPDVEIVLFGSDDLDATNVPFPFTNLGIVRDLNALADLYRQSSAALVFSTTNPSVMPLEMMACGCPVIELDNTINRFHFQPPDCVTLAPEDPQAIADALERLLKDDGMRQRQIEAGLTFARALPNHAQAALRIEALLRQGLLDA